MKAVNLLPREAQRSFGTFRGLGGGTTALLGALSLGCVVAIAYVVMANAVTSKRNELAQVNAQQAAAQQQVAKLKPYADLEQARTALLDRVRTLASGRFDWPGTLARIARAIPADAKLKSLNGAASQDASGAPTISLSGCTPSHDSAASLIDRLRAVEGVAGVSLQSSTLNQDATPSGDCPGREQFEMTVALTAPPSAAAATPGQTAGAAAAAQPAPATPAASTTTPATTPAGGSQ